MEEQCVILFGGGGIIGSKLSDYYESLGYEVINVSLEFPFIGRESKETRVVGDINNDAFILPLLNKICGRYGGIHSVYFIVTPNTELFTIMLDMLESQSDAVTLISTIYADEKLRYSNPYLLRKRREEKKVLSSKVQRKFIYRLPHVVGENTLIGCVPPYNRVPFKTIEKFKFLGLSIDSDIPLYYIDPSDIPLIINVLDEVYPFPEGPVNLFNPHISSAIAYYEIVIDIVNPGAGVGCIGRCEEDDFWYFTTLNMNLNRELMEDVAKVVRFTSLRSSLIKAASTSGDVSHYSGDIISRINSY